MSTPDLPSHVRQLLADSIQSVSQLEVLLLLLRESGTVFTPERIASELYIQVQPAAEHLSKLEASGLVTRTTTEPVGYRYGTRSNDLDRAVRDLAGLYSVMRLRIITEIMSNPHDSIQSFADAFKFRKDKDNEE